MQKTLTRYGLFVLTLIASLCFTQQAKASHAMGADLSYECIDPTTNTYKVVLRFYRDCSGIDAPTSVFININSAICGQSLSVTLNQEPCPPATNGGQPCEVSPLCQASINQSTCNGGTLPGVEAFTYSGTVQLPANCPDWVFSFSECCRNMQITNLLNPDSEDLYVEAHLNNSTGTCNSSPVFTTLPVPFICANQPFSYNHGAVDADGDSLVYTLINPLGAGAAQIQYNGFSPTYPLATSPANNFGFDNNTGQMTFTPNGTQVAVVTVLVEEYRNGVLIGSTMRDIQIVVVNLPGCANPQPVFTGAIANTVTNGIFIDPFHIQVCPGNVLSFTTLALEQTGDSIFVESNISQAIPAAIYSSSYISQDSIYSQFSWTPSGLDTGTNVFIVTIKNNHCPLASNLAYAINVEVLAGTYAGPDLSYCPAGGPVQLQAYGGTAFSWTPTAGLNNPNIGNPLASPSQTTTYVVTSNLSNNCKNKDTVTVYRVPDFNYTVSQSDDTICRFEFVTLTANGDPQYGPYTYSWQPDSLVLQPHSSTTTSQPDYSSHYTLVITSDTGCIIHDTTLYVVVSGQGPQVLISADKNKVCPGDTIHLTSQISTVPCGLNVVPCTGNFDLKTLGTGTVQDFGGATPYRGFYMDSRVQILYRASELQALGMQAGTITDIGFDIAQTGSTIPYNGFSIKMGCTNLQQLTSFVPGLSTVMNPVAYTPTGTGYNIHTFDNPYDWDGVSNLIIEVCFDNNTFTNDDIVNATTTPYNSMLYNFQDNAVGCNLSTPFLSSNRPNTQFIYCIAPPKNVTYSWTPTTDLSPVDSLNPIVTLHQSTTYYLNADDGNCSGGGSITLNIDTSFNVSVGPDVPICNGVPLQLNAVITGTPPLGGNLTCGQVGTGCNGTPVVKTLSMTGTFTSTYTPFDGDIFATNFEDMRTQILYTAADLAASGFTAGTINRIGFNITTKQSGFPFQNLSIKLGCTNKTTLDDNSWEPTQLVYGNVLYATVAGWNDFPFQTTFDWDGSSNLVVEVCWDNPDGFPSTGADYVSSAFVNYNCFHSGNGALTVGCNILTPTFNLAQELPMMRMQLCPPPPLPVTYNWSPGTALSATNIANPVATPNQPTTYVVAAYFGGTCPKYDTITITPQPFFYAVSGDTGMCEGQSVTLSVAGGNTYQWAPPFDLSCTDCPNPVASPSTTATYYVTVSDNSTGCSAVDTVVVSVQNLSVTAVYGDTLVDQGTPINIAAVVSGAGGPGSYTYSWTPSQYLDNASAESPVSAPLGDVLYTLTVSSGPCSDTTTVNVRVNIIESPVYMPNVFSPNGDGKNDGFYPVSFNNIASVKEFRIYNRYGELVHNSNTAWNGEFKGKQQPAGTYVYYIVVSRPFKDDEKIQGAFTLLR